MAKDLPESGRLAARSLARSVKGAVRRVRDAGEDRTVPAPTSEGRPSLANAARAVGWDNHQPTQEFLAALEEALGRRRPPAVAVLLGEGSREWSGVVQSLYPRARMVTLDVGAMDEGELHARLAAGGRYDVVVDDTVAGAEKLPLLQNAFLHLRGSGTLFVRLEPSHGRRLPTWWKDVDDPWGFVRTALSGHDIEEPLPGIEKDREALAAAVSDVAAGRGHLALKNRAPVLAKLREPEVDMLLDIRGKKAGAVITELPAQRFESRCLLRENTEHRDELMPAVYPVPAMSLREYHDVTCWPRQVVVQRNLVLPDTYRFNAEPRLRNRFIPDVGPRFAEVPQGPKKMRRLEGSYFYLDSEWTGHFGHAMTEQMSRLWAVTEARAAAPDLKVIMSRRHKNSPFKEFEREIYGAAGFDEADFVLHHRPVRVERLLAASPMFAMPTHVHPGLRELWGEIGGRLAASAPDRDYPRRIFCSRRRERRLCQNLPEVEALFEAHGFTVVYPEDMPFVEQVRMFREADVIAGFAGSAMFNACFTPTPRKVIVLGPTTYTARNEYMICAVVGHELDYVWSEPDAEQASGPQPQYAGFRFDFEREGVFLKETLASL